MKKLFVISILTGLFLPVFVFGAVSYERSPSGYTITSPVDFSIVIPEEELPSCGEGLAYWILEVNRVGFMYSGEHRNILSWVETLPLAEGVYVSSRLRFVDGIGYTCGDIIYFEYNLDGVFEIVETPPPPPPPPTGIFTIPNITDITDYIQELFAGSGLYPLIALIIGLPLAFWSIQKIIDLKDKKERKKRKLEVLKKFKTKKADWL